MRDDGKVLEGEYDSQRSKTSTVIYGSETLSLRAQDRRKIGVFEIMCLRNICGIIRVDIVRNAIVRELWKYVE